MAFLKYARATVVHPRVDKKTWKGIRTAGIQTQLSVNLIDQAGEIFDSKFNPEQYLLTHATIVASVDTYDVSNMKMGSVTEDGFRVNRKFSNFRIKPECDRFINNNLDSWDRDVLLKSYRTFIGAHNFVEHVQVEDLSRGRIIDACARDIGDSVYIDILVATDRKNGDLVKSIEGGKMGSMSMGCTVDFTICTKCGHVAADETEMCKHVRYEKGNTFFDQSGGKHRVAELCGHPSVDPTGGVHFIEASWVETPAFGGAVMRNILSPQEVDATIVRKAQRVLATLPEDWDETARRKAAMNDMSDGIYAGWGDDEEEGGADDAGEEGGSLGDFEAEVQKLVLNRIKGKIRQELGKKDLEEELSPDPSPESSSVGLNDNVIKEAAEKRRKVGYNAALGLLIQSSSTDADLINKVATFNNFVGLSIPRCIYRTALQVGKTDRYGSLEGYLHACADSLGRSPTVSESKTLMRLGKLLSVRDNNMSDSTPPKKES